MRFKVIAYRPTEQIHEIEAVEGETYEGHHAKRVGCDILVDGGIGHPAPESLVGKEFECEYIYPCTFIATAVRAAEEQSK